LKTIAVPVHKVIMLFLIFGLFLLAGWEGLIALVTVALRLEVRNTRKNDKQQPEAEEPKIVSEECRRPAGKAE
jgi:hypothetical protein